MPDLVGEAAGRAGRRVSSGVTSSGSTGRASMSALPRGGSLTISFSAIATSTPGTPTMKKAIRQFRYWAISPPKIAPSMPPTGMPNA